LTVLRVQFPFAMRCKCPFSSDKLKLGADISRVVFRSISTVEFIALTC